MRVGIRASHIQFTQKIQIRYTKCVESANTNLSTPFIVRITVTSEKFFCCKFTKKKLSVSSYIVQYFIFRIESKMHFIWRAGIRRFNRAEEDDRIQIRQFKSSMTIGFCTVCPDNRLKKTKREPVAYIPV